MYKILMNTNEPSFYLPKGHSYEGMTLNSQSTWSQGKLGGYVLPSPVTNCLYSPELTSGALEHKIVFEVQVLNSDGDY